MAQFLRGKQAGIQRDLSAGLTPELFDVDLLARYGVSSQIKCLAYDPIQSLLAVGTSDSRYGGGQIYVFGQKRISATLAPPRPATIKSLQFCADKLVSLDSRNEVTVFSLESAKKLCSYSPPGVASTLLTDPSLDFAFIGLQNGDIVAYDMDRQTPAPFRIGNLCREIGPRAKLNQVVSLAFHPRDIGTMLVGYAEGAAIYSFKQAKATTFFRYEPASGALRGGSDPTSRSKPQVPRLVQARWHPTGTFVLTTYEDESLVVWDPKTGRLIHARSIHDMYIDKPGSTSESLGSAPGAFALKTLFSKVAWCCKQNPDDTGILIVGGMPVNVTGRGLTFFELGQTPVYATSSWQVLSEHFAQPRSNSSLRTPPGTEVVDFCLIPRASPHFAGCQDPIAVIALLSSGELMTMSFPSGHPIPPANQLHVCLSFVHPFVDKFSATSMPRNRWLNLNEKRNRGPPILGGGAETNKRLLRFEDRNILLTSHVNGVIHIWDAGSGDEIENDAVIRVDLSGILGPGRDPGITKVSLSRSTGELVIGTRSGDVVLFRWDRVNEVERNTGPQPEAFGLRPIHNNADPEVREGLIPLTMLSRSRGAVTATQVCDIGFVAAAFEDGTVVAIDLRGPALIFEENVLELSKVTKRGTMSHHRKSSSGQHTIRPEWPTCLEFGIMTLENDDYSSICLFVGTNHGRFVTLKLLPEPHGGYSVRLAGAFGLEDAIVSISPINADSGALALASQPAAAELRRNIQVNGVVVAVTTTGARIFRPTMGKGANKTWGDFFCYSATVATNFDGKGIALLGVFGDGTAKTFSIPALKEMASEKIDHLLDISKLQDVRISPSGHIFGWKGPSEIVVLHPWGTGQDFSNPQNSLFNPQALIPPRPTISNIQWISGTQHVTPSDMDILIGGPDRPPSKRMIEQMRAEDQQRKTAGRTGTNRNMNEQADEGYWSYMSRQIQERTERLNIVGDSMDRLGEQSSGWANDVGKFVNQQKKKAVMGVIGSKLGF